MSVTTNSLMRRITKAGNIKDVLSKEDGEFIEESAADLLKRLAEEKNLRRGQIIADAGIERTYGHQLFNGTRTPSRDKLIQLSIGLKLSVDETQTLLKRCGESPLYAKIRRDAVIIFGISHKNTFIEIQQLLDSEKLPLLGEG